VACSSLGVQPEEAVYVGDVPNDLACALAAGTHFIGYGGMVPEAAFQTNSFREIEAMLRMLEG
jgi:phosphoglycolate phosphatase-like HAD superfamily hydrolase